MASNAGVGISAKEGYTDASDLELFAHIEQKLYTAVISDALDELGYSSQAMREWLRPLFLNNVIAGRARTILCMDLYHVPEDPFASEIAAVDSILPNEIVVVGTGESKRNAPWGELLSTAAKGRGARGAIVDGIVRDVRKIQELQFPVFASGIKPVDSKGRGTVVQCNVPVECGQVLVKPGDLIVADFDGVIVVPTGLVEPVVRMATEKALRETQSRGDLLKGAYLRDVYNTYGVL